MRLPGSILVLLPLSLAAQDSWPQILSSIGGESVLVARSGTPLAPSWKERVENGAYLILEGESPLAASFGFRPSATPLTLTSMLDVHQPKLPLILEHPLETHSFTLPAGARVFTRDRWSGAPLVAGMNLGKGAVLWVGLNPGPQGYERFPYLPQALSDLGFVPPFRAQRTWAFFDYSYRTRVDLDYFAARWHNAGISALHVASWHFYEPDPGRDAYLKHLIEACHAQGILVYAWLELPHVSEKFWSDHPEWREKTAVLQDAALDWRKLMNLQNPDCVQAIKTGISHLMDRFDWDGVNMAELYFESLEGASNPSRFTPLNADVRASFKAQYNFDPVDLWSARKDQASLRMFLDFRASLAQHMQQDWLAEMEKYRSAHPDLDIVLTHVDDRMDTGMTDAIGADSTRVLPLLDRQNFTFLVEDPATVWNLGPRRYPEIARRYPASAKLAIDINVVERYQDVYPTRQQTGTELFELVHLAAASFPRVALYFENSILPTDLPLLSAASAVVTSFHREGAKLTVDSPHGLIAPWTGAALVDGKPWAALDGREVNLPAGKHTVEPSAENSGPRLVAFNGDLQSATWQSGRVEISYASSSRALATLDCPAAGRRTLILPSGERHASVSCSDSMTSGGTGDSR